MTKIKEFDQRNRLGFTVIELLIGLFVLGLVALAAWTILIDAFSFNDLISLNLGVQEEARNALKMMTAEIRAASPSSGGAHPIAEATTTSLTFYSNIDNDALKERIRYFLDGEILKKGTIKPTGNPPAYNPADEKIKEVIHSVTNGVAIPVFEYYDANYDGATLPLNQPIDELAVRLVKVAVHIEPASRTSLDPLILETQVSIRNVKDNL